MFCLRLISDVGDGMDIAKEIIFCAETHVIVHHLHRGHTEFCGQV